MTQYKSLFTECSSHVPYVSSKTLSVAGRKHYMRSSLHESTSGSATGRSRSITCWRRSACKGCVYVEGDRPGSNPRPSLEPQSADIRFQRLLYVAESAYLSRFPCWWLPDVAACSALSG